MCTEYTGVKFSLTTAARVQFPNSSTSGLVAFPTNNIDSAQRWEAGGHDLCPCHYTGNSAGVTTNYQTGKSVVGTHGHPGGPKTIKGLRKM